MQSNYEEKKCDICRGRDIQGGCPKCLKYNNLRNNTFIDACQPQNEGKEKREKYVDKITKLIEQNINHPKPEYMEQAYCAGWEAACREFTEILTNYFYDNP